MNGFFPPILLSAANDMPTLGELWNDFFKNYINNDTEYENLNMGGSIPVSWIVIALFLGVAVAAVWIVVSKRLYSGFVSRLIENDCLSPEGAMTLPELSYADKLAVRYAVRKSVALRRVVRCREEEEWERENEQRAKEYAQMLAENPKLPKKFKAKEIKYDLDSFHFYIPEEEKTTAQTKFSSKGTSIWMLVLALGLMTAVLFVLLLFLPSVMALIDSTVGQFKN